MKLFVWLLCLALLALLSFGLPAKFPGHEYDVFAILAVLAIAGSAITWSPEAVEHIVKPKSGDSRVALSFFFAAALISMAVITVIGLSTQWKEKNLGTFGDFLGGTLNPILTFLSFIALLFTLVIQQREIQAANQQSADLLKERTLDRARAAREQFEATFFQMLNYHNAIVSSIDIHRAAKPLMTSRESFKYFRDQMAQSYIAYDALDERRRAETAYNDVWTKFRKDLAHYYRFLYNLIRFINQSGLPKKKYIRIVRAQLSDFEMVMLFYNGLTPYGSKFKEYIEFFTLFDNLSEDLLFDPSHAGFYAPSAFLDSATKKPLSFIDVDPDEVAEQIIPR